jgi:hypothetical protein
LEFTLEFHILKQQSRKIVDCFKVKIKVMKLKRISESEAHKYIPVELDFTGSKPTFYTITSTPEDPEWDIITYYTARKTQLYQNREGEGDSWIYILANKTMPNLLKIGFTTKEPDKRAEQVSRSTGVPLKFTVEYAVKCFNGQRLEVEIHKALNAYRINDDREFFQLSLEEAKRTIDTLSQHYK